MSMKRAAAVIALTIASLWGLHCSSNSAPVIVRDAGTVAQPDATVSETSAPVVPDAGSKPLCDPTAAMTPLRWAPPTPFSNACTADQIAAYMICFTGTGDCTLFRAENASCAACLETDEAAAAHGPVVTTLSFDTVVYLEANYGGCVAHFDGDLSDAGCGESVNAQQDCVYHDCSGCADFGLMDAGPVATACEDNAVGLPGTGAGEAGLKAGCKAATAPCEGERADGGVAAACAGGVQDLLTLWCGGGGISTDAGGGDAAGTVDAAGD